MIIFSCSLNCRFFYQWAEYSPFFLRISPCGQQFSNQLPVAVLGGNVQRGDTILARCINPGPGGQQGSNQLPVAVLGGDVQGGGAILARCINPGPSGQQVSRSATISRWPLWAAMDSKGTLSPLTALRKRWLAIEGFDTSN